MKNVVKYYTDFLMVSFCYKYKSFQYSWESFATMCYAALRGHFRWKRVEGSGSPVGNHREMLPRERPSVVRCVLLSLQVVYSPCLVQTTLLIALLMLITPVSFGNNRTLINVRGRQSINCLKFFLGSLIFFLINF